MKFKHKLFIIITLITFLALPIKSFSTDNTQEPFNILEASSSSDITSIPSINARHAVVFDRSSKTVLYGKNENETCKMASTTKILTGIIVIENCNDLNSIVTVSKKSAGTGGSRLGLHSQDKISVIDLLYGLLMVSGNDAAATLAEYISGSIQDFSILMNNKAKSLGLTSSHFITPHGLDQDEHYTTAFELAKIADYALQNETFAKIVNTSNYTITINSNPKNLHNTNELLGSFEGVYGVKTGFTNGANRCLVTSCKKGNLDIICVVLGCDTKKDRGLDSIKLINYTFDNFILVDASDIIQKKFDNWNKNCSNLIYINKGISYSSNFYLDLSNIPFKNIAVKNEFLDLIDANITIFDYFEAPLYENDAIGNVSFSIGDVNYFSVDILNKHFVRRKNVFDYMSIFMKNILSY